MSDAGRRPVVVIGLGSTMRHDDGLGPAVVEVLADDLPADAEAIVLDGESTRLVDAWQGRRRVVVIDAVTTGAPAGTIHEIDGLHQPLPGWNASASSHRVGLAEAVALGRVLDRLPDELIVTGVEPEDLSVGPGLSPTVAAQIPTLARRVRELLHV